MSAAKENIHEWSTTDAQNFPIGTFSARDGWAPSLRNIQAAVKKQFSQGSDISAASNLGLQSVEEGYVDVTCSGTVNITALSDSSVPAGVVRYLRFKSTGTSLTITHNATSLICPSGADIGVTAGDIAKVMSIGSGNWAVLSYLDAMPSFKLGAANVAASTMGSPSTVSYTGVGFKPRFLYYASVGGYVNLKTQDSLSIGLTDGTTDANIEGDSPGTETTPGTWVMSGDLTSGYISRLRIDPTAQLSGSFSSFDADGFTINWYKTGSGAADGTSYYHHFICFR